MDRGWLRGEAEKIGRFRGIGLCLIRGKGLEIGLFLFVFYLILVFRIFLIVGCLAGWRFGY